MEYVTWRRDVVMPSFDSLRDSIDCDVVIIGGGITGIMCAYFLSEEGKRVVVVEKDVLCSGASEKTTAFLTSKIDTSLKKLVDMFGEAHTRNIVLSHQRAIDEIERIVIRHGIDCEFMRCSHFLYAPDSASRKYLRLEERTARRVGLAVDLKEGDFSFRNYGSLEFFHQGKFHPLKFLAGLVRVIKKNGLIFEGTEVTHIEKGPSCVVSTHNGTIRARHVIVATYAPFDRRLFFKKAFYDSYVAELQVPSGFFREGTYEDTRTPYHYFRVDSLNGYDRVIIGGEDHRSDISVERGAHFEALDAYIADLMGTIAYTLVTQWRGPIVEPIDGKAFIGPMRNENVFYATGFSGNGMTYAMIAADILTSFITGRKGALARYSSVYAPERIPKLTHLAHKGIDYTRELFGGVVRNSLFFGWRK